MRSMIQHSAATAEVELMPHLPSLQDAEPETSSDLRKASNRFLWIASLTAAVLTLTAMGLSIWLVKNEVEPHDNLAKSIRLLRTTNSRMAAFGDSRLAFGFAPWPGGVNLAYQGETVADMMARSQVWAQREGAPLEAVIEADPHLFATYRAAAKPKAYLAPPGPSRSFLIDERHMPLLPMYWGIFLTKGKFRDKYAFQPNGWQQNPDRLSDIPEDERVGRIHARVYSQLPSADFEKAAPFTNYVKLVRGLASKKVRLCLVTTPVPQKYREEALGNETYRRALATYRRLAGSVGASYVDMSDWVPAPEDITSFADTDHLTPAAARRFSDAVRQKCKL